MQKSLMNLRDLKNVLSNIELPYPILLSFEDSIWHILHGEIYWNTDNNLEDLENGDGNTYSAELTEGVHIQDGYLVCNCDTGTGTWQTMIFDLSKEIKFDE